MEWKGRLLQTIGDLMSFGIDSCETREEAQEFMRQYRQVTPYANMNIGYLSGYYGDVDRKRIQEWFGVQHPFLPPDASKSDALRVGLQIGKSMKRGRDV